MEAVDEGESPSEPQDLSLVDFSRSYGCKSLFAEGAEPGDADDAPALGSSPRGGGGGGQSGSSSKLNCDICGLSCISINVLLVHKRSHTGERPFHCVQCGASFTQKGNLLRHIKLHSGEKPFKCHMCNYACRRRDALSGHLRTHSVEKPYKCNHCGRSYKQRSSLEEHRERCHVYAQNRGSAETVSHVEDGQAVRSQMGSERALLLDKLASNVAKRKSSMPQKFTGDNGVCLDLSFNRGPMRPTDATDPPLRGSPGADVTALDHETPLSHRHYPVQLTRSPHTNGHKLSLPAPGGLSLPAPSPQGPHHGLEPSPGDASPVPQSLIYNLGHLLGGFPNGLPHPHPHAQGPAQGLSMGPLEAMRVLKTEGDPGGLLAPAGALYPCSHCRVIYLDYVMFTIHMGCHGFRDPLECNVCGHRSRDRYEFTSHIARGEHRTELK
ncbi:zinc finger protein Aiolos-like [Gadus macrocephalus]|uniref:zinc finger protein Aiolos-like n=1 Tax=Gadus macrocephalus TaxID=80720 RepID=UPI0028CB312B|nr:zinc finger protein Aiolos-like [Gadus macrocephalus]XP_059904167.1 zinc finger protein Aiolos-like [Gadus macrocephalus]XP_059904168.1 zinc finger protein Aiolos-like [Gadus macrocephalus]